MYNEVVHSQDKIYRVSLCAMYMYSMSTLSIQFCTEYMCNNGLLRAEMFPASFEGWRQIRHDQVNDIIL